MTRKLATLISSLCLLAVLCGGCTVTLTGGGTLRVGMSNANYLEFSHTVDGDKANKTSESKLEIDQPILDAVLPSPPDPSRTASTGSPPE